MVVLISEVEEVEEHGFVGCDLACKFVEICSWLLSCVLQALRRVFELFLLGQDELWGPAKHCTLHTLH